MAEKAARDAPIGVIPARGGSKRIPRKNIRDFLGRPIISYPIAAMKESGLFSRIIVSTDDEEIAAVARASGAEVPFRRTAELAGDTPGIADVLIDVLDRLSGTGDRCDCLCCALPTAALLRPRTLRAGWELLTAGEGAPAVVPIVRFEYPLQRALRIAEDGTVEMVWPENYPVRSQDLPARYHDAGQFYWITSEALRRSRTMFPPGSRPLVLGEREVQDIDDLEDWERAEYKYRTRTGE